MRYSFLLGIEGGIFFTRGRTKKINGEYLEIRDLAPGNIVNILGREIHIFDADKCTRDYFRCIMSSILQFR